MPQMIKSNVVIEKRGLKAYEVIVRRKRTA